MIEQLNTEGKLLTIYGSFPIKGLSDKYFRDNSLIHKPHDFIFKTLFQKSKIMFERF